MRTHPTRVAPFGLLALAVALLPLAAGAAPQHHDETVRHREVVVLGPHGGHARLLGALARRAFLGIEMVDLTPELRRHFGAPGDRGVLVSRVVEESPAEATGIRVGDLIVAVDGEPLRGAMQLAGRLARRREGDAVELELRRDGGELTVRATLAENERRQLEIGQFLWRDEEGEPRVLGLDPDGLDRVIAIDPEWINESVRGLMERLEAGELAGRFALDDERRERLERRLEELEERLREMERRLRGEDPGAD